MIFNESELNIIVNSDELSINIAESQDHPEFQITLINILPHKYFEDCRIKDSINIDADVIADFVDDWDRARYIVVYGASDDLTMSKLVHQRLSDMGFINVRILLGGMQEWLDDGYPCEGACKMDYLQD